MDYEALNKCIIIYFVQDYLNRASHKTLIFKILVNMTQTKLKTRLS